MTWVLIEELHTDGWHIGGEPFSGPPSLMATLGRSKVVYEMIDGNPTSRDEFAAVLPQGRGYQRIGGPLDLVRPGIGASVLRLMVSATSRPRLSSVDGGQAVRCFRISALGALAASDIDERFGVVGPLVSLSLRIGAMISSVTAQPRMTGRHTLGEPGSYQNADVPVLGIKG